MYEVIVTLENKKFEEGGEEMMKERAGFVTMRGNPLTLVGNEVRIGEVAPDFTAIDPNLTPIKFSSYRNKICIVSSVPSLDTPVCDMETRKFNEEASKLGDKIQILTVSMDLPFAQKRWCGTAGVNKIQTLSDHREAQFGLAYGVLIKELRLLARAVFLVDQQGILQYTQLVKEIASEPDYDEIWNALKKIP